MGRLTDRPDMTLDVYRGRKATMQQQQQRATSKITKEPKQKSRLGTASNKTYWGGGGGGGGGGASTSLRSTNPRPRLHWPLCTSLATSVIIFSVSCHNKKIIQNTEQQTLHMKTCFLFFDVVLLFLLLAVADKIYENHGLSKF